MTCTNCRSGKFGASILSSIPATAWPTALRRGMHQLRSAPLLWSCVVAGSFAYGRTSSAVSRPIASTVMRWWWATCSLPNSAVTLRSAGGNPLAHSMPMLSFVTSSMMARSAAEIARKGSSGSVERCDISSLTRSTSCAKSRCAIGSSRVRHSPLRNVATFWPTAKTTRARLHACFHTSSRLSVHFSTHCFEPNFSG
jgi:hypothetical protein